MFTVFADFVYSLDHEKGNKTTMLITIMTLMITSDDVIGLEQTSTWRVIFNNWPQLVSLVVVVVFVAFIILLEVSLGCSINEAACTFNSRQLVPPKLARILMLLFLARGCEDEPRHEGWKPCGDRRRSVIQMACR